MSTLRARGGKLIVCLVMQAVLAGTLAAQTAPSAAEIAFAGEWLARVSAASSEQEVLVATMLAQQHQPAVLPGLLNRELAALEHERLRLSLAWYHCHNDPEAEPCKTHAFAAELITLDPTNLEPYLYATVTLLEAGREAEALHALTRGNGATEADTYYLAKQNLVRSVLARVGYPRERLNAATESLPAPVATYLLYAGLLSTCAQKGKTSIDWKTQCVALGGKLEALGNTVVQNVHGMAIQRDVLGDGGAEGTQRAAVVTRLAAYNQIRDRAAASLPWINDETLKPELVYEEINRFGEIQAIERALQRQAE